MKLVCLGNEKKPSVAGELEKGMPTHSSILAWRITWTEEPGGRESTGSHKTGHDQATNTWLEHKGEGEARVHRRLEADSHGAVKGFEFHCEFQGSHWRVLNRGVT